MAPDAYNAFCRGLAHTDYVVQWGGAHVWKIGGKVFAIGALGERGLKDLAPGDLAVTFKVSPLAFDILREQPGLRPAPYLASRGMKWIQCTSHETLSEEDLCAYIKESYRLVGAGLPKKRQRELGLLD